MISSVQHNERIFRVWSDRRERELSVRVQFSVADHNGCRVYNITGRQEWWI
jgi:hypothetical protein